MGSNADLVAGMLRAGDRDRYLAALYAPAERRAALNALYAFDAEIAGLRDRVREALPGEIRLQWWRDAIATGEAATGNPLADELIGAITQHRLPKPAFDAYLEARIFDLYDDPMPSRTDLEGFCGETASAVFQLAALILDPAAAPAVSELAGHAGCVTALVRILRSLPIQRRRGQCYVPRDILVAVGTTPERFNTVDDASAHSAVGALIALAAEHLRHFEAGAARLPPGLRAAFLPVAIDRARLAAYRRPETLLDGVPDLPGWRRQWILFRTAAMGWR
ncbi:MAG: phytoene/squalene synthase family protein [Rhizobiaceae bacterium]|nr:phytoene/squalene synthase family protein [Rhizobiaceae bacterium]